MDKVSEKRENPQEHKLLIRRSVTSQELRMPFTYTNLE